MLNISPLALLSLPPKVRLSIIGFFFLICVIVYWFTFPLTHNGNVLLIPMLLSAWMFGFRGAFMNLIVTIAFLICLNSLIEGTIFWPPAIFLSMVIGCIIALLVGVLVGSLRATLDKLQAARLKESEAEREKTIAYEQRVAALEAEKQMTIAYKQQRYLNALKDQFIVNVNHELRTPLTEVYGYIELLKIRRGELDDNMQTIFLQKALDGCEELMSLINNVLDATHASSEVQLPQQEVFSIAPVVRDVVDHLDPREEQEHTFLLDVPESLTVWADEQHVRQILRNLLSNACKYAPIDTPVSIRVTSDDSITQRISPSPQVCISVKDEGPGIPADQIPLLFEKFVRLKRDVSGAVRGTGLGLYISKQLVTAMGGHIWVESSGVAGEGCLFCFTLPCAALE